ncbi:hypothetical protein [Bdellovibrio sp. HCB337]|uniref:hypothetical protein n=1 Tax=Bdellovibrio sp. HCB337 TaxID=3394358 RepID=UPI0039A43819
MKTLITLALGLLVMTASQVAQAKCNPPDPFENACIRNEDLIASKELKKAIFGKTICPEGSHGQRGLAISEKGIVASFASNWGMPDPTTYYRVSSQHASLDQNILYFVINKYFKATDELLGTSDDYAYHKDTKVITSGEFSLSEAACLPEQP